jgi:aspartate dehydrogenase
MKVLIIGCGAIGVTVAKAISKMEKIEKIYMFDKDTTCSAKLSVSVPKVEGCPDIAEKLDEVELVIEAASQQAVKQYAPAALSRGKSILLMSIGALVDDAFREQLEKLAKEKKCRIYLPSGAVAGIDALSAASNAEIEEVILISYKPVAAFRNVPYIAKKGIDLDSLKTPTIVFDGNAREAVQYFPQNINVAATVSLAGIGFERTKVKLIADPTATRNTHKLIVKGAFGELESEIRNLPFPKNPRTSYVAALSAVAAVKNILGDAWVRT